MKYHFTSFSLLFTLLVSSANATTHPHLREPSKPETANVGDAELLVKHMAKFHTWMEFHEKQYSDHDEKMQRIKTWIENDRKIEEHNSQVPPPKYTLGHNEFSDMNGDEFAQHFKLGKYSNPPESFGSSVGVGGASMIWSDEDEKNVDLPDYVNWVAMGGVTPVKNQGYCGACWAFSTTGALEGAKFIRTGELVSLSEQNLLDCDHTDMGCNGGLMDNAFKFDEKSGGLCSEADYPYKAKQGKCNTTCTDVPGTIVKTFLDVPPGKEKALLSAISVQPISVAVQGGTFAFQFYKGGVVTDESCGKNGDIDHGVLAVGYGTDLETQEPYWLVKNSWGASWGENGFIKLGRDTKNEWGICAILKMASFPEVEA
jgi:cathepsin L